MFQFAFERPLLPFTYEAPALAPLFRLPPPCHSRNVRDATVSPRLSKLVAKGDKGA